VNLIKVCAERLREVLRDSSVPLTAAELSDRSHLSPNLVRRGLDVLVVLDEVTSAPKVENLRRRGALPLVYSLK
jgi:hypothetical protein